MACALRVIGPPLASEPAHQAGVGPVAVLATARHQPAVPSLIPVPDPDLLEAVPEDAGYSLPKRGATGLLPRDHYAAPKVVVPAGNARVALLLDGVGMSATLSREVIDTLPGPVSLSVSPYAPDPGELLQDARVKGHETLLSLPMQPSASPVDDEGPHALGYDHSVAVDQANLRWSLSRFSGYVGVTNAFSGMDGNAFAQSPDFRAVSDALEQRGLLYVNATPGDRRVGNGVGRDASMSLNMDGDAAAIDAQLARLEQMAKTGGEAMAVAGPLRPVALDRIRLWIAQLADHGVTLVPVSALSQQGTSQSANAATP